jgi:hypothetical protein
MNVKLMNCAESIVLFPNITCSVGTRSWPNEACNDHLWLAPFRPAMMIIAAGVNNNERCMQ